MTIRPREAWDLLYEAVNSKDCALRNPQMFIDHVHGVEKTVYQMAYDLFRNGYDINPDLAVIYGILHDIGRTRPEAYEGGTDVHEYYTGEMLRQAGLPLVANIAQRHFVAYEKAGQILVPRGIDVDPKYYKQIELPSKILNYADLIVTGEGIRTNDWRGKLDGLIPKYKKGEDEKMVQILSQDGLKRMGDLCEKMEMLLESLY